MLKKKFYEQSLAADGWFSLDPADGEIIGRLFAKDIQEGEEKLMLAVLENAVECFQKYVFAKDEKGKKLFQEAEEWISDKNSDWLYSFENICEVLGLHPDYMRRGLMGWKETRFKHHARRVNFHRTHSH